MDNLTPIQRRKTMAAVRSVGTIPENRVAKALHSQNIQFRRQKGLPGKPDFVVADLKAVFFVHGCFWHSHGCRKRKIPHTNRAYWQRKISANQKRDRRVRRQLNKRGWTVLWLWECHLTSAEDTQNQVLTAINRAIQKRSVGMKTFNKTLRRRWIEFR